MAKVERRPIAQKTVTITAPNKKPPKWQSLVSELEELDSDTLLVLTPEDGDSMRALKVQVARAAKAAGKQDDIQYGVGDSEELEVWLREKPRQRRPRKSKES